MGFVSTTKKLVIYSLINKPMQTVSTQHFIMTLTSWQQPERQKTLPEMRVGTSFAVP